MRHFASPKFWTAYEALPLAVELDGGYLWFWIGSHGDYDRLIG